MENKSPDKNKGKIQQSSPSKGPRIDLRKPMKGIQDNQGVDDEARQLISPPPEEILRSKRKRTSTTTTTTPQATPNPKPRKQLHIHNPNADFIPFNPRPSPVPYSPPNHRFESPREITLSPTKSKSSRRKSTRGLRIKTEPPPDLDLHAPMPPASPTDDPLLLSEPPRRLPSESPSSSLPPSSPPPPSSPHLLDFTSYNPANLDTSSPMDTSFDFDGPIPNFTLPPIQKLSYDLPNNGFSTDSEDEDEGILGQGEYTGHFRQLTILTKPDPPDARTKERMDNWGRPISPYPYEVDRSARESGRTSPSPSDSPHDDDEAEEAEVRQLSLPPDDEAQPAPPVPSSPLIRDLSLFGLPRTSVSPRKKSRRESLAFERAKALFGVRDSSPVVEQEEEVTPAVEEEEARPDEQVDAQPEEFVAVHDDESSSEDEDDQDPSVVKITSADPRAAARAVAILKQHDYDCYTRLLSKPKPKHKTLDDLRRKTIGGGGITKVGRKTKTPRRKSIALGDDALHDLLDEASASFSLSTPLRKAPTQTPKKPEATGSPEWNKDHWKFLDGCFTDLRIPLSEDEPLLPVEDVDIDAVVDRFIDLIGGEEGLVGWPREEIHARALAIRKKQMRGVVGAPATPLTLPASSRRFATPEFTPSKRGPPETYVLPSPIGPSAPFSALRAPRYGHLIEEAREVAVASPQPTLGGRMKGILFSYLPTLSTKLAPQPPKRTLGPGLPTPPPPKPRAPIETPARPPPAPSRLEKSVEDLTHIDLPLPASNIPVKREVKRLAELRHIETPEKEKERVVKRKSSSGSVRDLVKCFEEMDSQAGSRPASRVGSISKGGGRPVWKP
ncbi:hypothetical protein Moror_2892 [Moniliophthora roreri MCA 2997]|uniref:Uncharacterized protein n=2 Tax=Moniliophthora roreri TaxID=221103 RepID=V2WWP0_MONRO|nr:hypothetical protein Moror_2892 [Moniliophthora roreri MCA 2997]KAI3611018.1 hypothetical protein WG66_013746 [Moniliophthora roreri]